MSEPMPYGARRGLTGGERDALSRGLAEALAAAGAEPEIIARPALGARIAVLWRGRAPILAWRDRIYWPGALDDFSQGGGMALLQHELQHVLEFATGELTALGYAVNPRNWVYRYELVSDRPWRAYGAEQRATMVEELWRLEHGAGASARLEPLRALIPWHANAPETDLRGVHDDLTIED